MPSLPEHTSTELPTEWKQHQNEKSLPSSIKGGKVRYPTDPTKYKYMINRHEQLDIHCNLFDSSFVEYFLDDANGNFDILFDQKLYEPPKKVLDHEKRMLEESEPCSNKKGGR
mmetsp:Transcript_5514/g.7378  ORF Transcript_5514/g.7378 Transcript_5514/m.7378 type:complete len:113 (-) Transcript_5514:103-441(-)